MKQRTLTTLRIKVSTSAINRSEGLGSFAGDAGGLFLIGLAFGDAAVAAFALLKFHEAYNQWQHPLSPHVSKS